MDGCKYCKELNEEQCRMFVDGLYINGTGYYNYSIPIIYCPKCGKMLDKYINKDGTPNEYEIKYGK